MGYFRPEMSIFFQGQDRQIEKCEDRRSWRAEGHARNRNKPMGAAERKGTASQFAEKLIFVANPAVAGA